MTRFSNNQPNHSGWTLIDSGDIGGFSYNLVPGTTDTWKIVLVVTIDSLDQFGSLEDLNLRGNKIEVVSDINRFQHLRKLDLAENQIETFPGINQLMNLERLCLEKNRLTTFEGVDKLVELRELYLSGNCIENAEQVKGIDRLPNRIFFDMRDIKHVEKNEDEIREEFNRDD